MMKAKSNTKKIIAKIFKNILLFVKLTFKSLDIELKPKMLSVSDEQTYRRMDEQTYGRTQ